jgi:hypothetical protein
LTFAEGAALNDPSHPFNSSLEGNVRRGINIHEGNKINEAAFEGADPRRRGAESQRPKQAKLQIEVHSAEHQAAKGPSLTTSFSGSSSGVARSSC